MRPKKNIIKTIFLLLLLPLTLLAVKKVIDLRKGAASVPANIVVDTQNPGLKVPSSLWRNLSQGGEEPVDMIKPIITQNSGPLPRTYPG